VVSSIYRRRILHHVITHSVRYLLASSLFFFFQAEDGIRDFHVTGVQTCALPISALKAQVIELLQAHEGAGDFLKITQLMSAAAMPTEKPGDRIGRYKLLQQIGEGGCGVVYMAEQEEIGRASCRERG